MGRKFLSATMNFERGQDVKESLNIGISKYPHVVRAMMKWAMGIVPLPLDNLIEFLETNSDDIKTRDIRITSVHQDDVKAMHEYWRAKKKGKLPKEDNLFFLNRIRGQKIVIRGKIYKIPEE